MRIHYFITFLLLGCVLGAPSCREKTISMAVPADIDSTNKVRQELGLRMIKPTWIFKGSRLIEYASPVIEERWSSTKNGYQTKLIAYTSDRNSMIYEEDYYYTGKVYAPSTGVEKDWECVTLHYDYRTKNAYLYYSGPNQELDKTAEKVGPGHPNHLPDVINEADKILKGLGISRL